MATDIIARGMITEYIAGTNINFTENRDGTVEISASGSISSEDSVARDAIGNHKSDTSNPHNVTPAQIGLGNVDNTSDLDKPISTAVQKAIDNKADKTVATISADGLMSAEDKVKLDAFEITQTGGKLHDKDIATTDLIPTTLPANGGNADYATNAGNADTVGGKHASDFKAYQEYTPVYEGDLLDIVEMGTYSCNVDYTPNLPNGVESWCYVTMIKCSTSGYKRYICTPFNLINTNNNILYLASEAYKDSDGKLIWQRVNDGGNANTVGGKGVNEFLAANILNNYDANTLYDAGIYLIANGANLPYAWGSLIGMPYRNLYGNLSPDFMGQIFIPNGDSGFENKMYFRTSQANIFNEWNEVYSSNSKPYITGNASVKAGSSVCVSEHGFIPSAVFWWEGQKANNVYAAVSFDSMSFTTNFSSNVDIDINFIIFK